LKTFLLTPKNQIHLVLKINSVATSALRGLILAFSGMENLFAEQQQQQLRWKPAANAPAAAAAAAATMTMTLPFCAVFVETKYREDMPQASRMQKVHLPAKSVSAGFASDEAFVLVPLQNVEVDDDDEDDDDPDDDDGGGTGAEVPKRRKKCVCEGSGTR
jgi:hypothetical protein